MFVACVFFPITPAQAQPPQAQDAQQVELSAQAYYGKWVGKWDEKWPVQFTIFFDTANAEIVVHYEWEESLGEPMRFQKLSARFEGNSLKIGTKLEIKVSSTKTSDGLAIGSFKKPRTARLHKVNP